MSEDVALEALLEFLDAAEAGIASAKRLIGERKGVETQGQQVLQMKEDDSNFDRLFWETRKGNKGPYQQTSKNANSNSDLWQQLQQKLKDHNGFWQHGCMRYWFHQNDQDIVDRRDGGSNNKKQGTK